MPSQAPSLSCLSWALLAAAFPISRVLPYLGASSRNLSARHWLPARLSTPLRRGSNAEAVGGARGINGGKMPS